MRKSSTAAPKVTSTTDVAGKAASNGVMMPKDTLASAQVWDIFAPAPGNTITGTLMPKMMARMNPNRRRRLSVEIHRVYTAEMKGSIPIKTTKSQSTLLSSTAVEDHDEYYEECVVRLLVPESIAIARESKRAAKIKKASSGTVYVPPVSDDVSALHDDDDGSVADGPYADVDDLSNVQNYNGWRAKYKLPISVIEIKSVQKRNVMLTTEVRGKKHTRDLIFDSEQEADNFVQVVESQKDAERNRSAIKLKHSLGGLKIAPSEEVTLLVEIVSGTDLPIADLKSSDPFVMCFMNDREVHRTAFISKTLEPVWTVKTGSLFLLTLTTKELFMSDGLMCEVADFDKLGANEILGAINIPPKTLYEAKGERMTFKLQKSPHSDVDFGKGSLSVRVRHATASDKKFMKDLEESTIKNGNLIEPPVAIEGGKNDIRSIVERIKKTEKRDDGSTIKKYRVRPHPDPNPDPENKEDPKWMSKQQIEVTVLKESREWIDISSGAVAKIFVEIIGCDGLPNLDSGGFLGNKTDAFVALVFEDAWAKTDVISDTLYPRWFPWTRRAFIFHQSHSSSQLFLGVFDHDTGIGDHDLIGRVSVDLSNLRPNTVYNLTYDIYPSARMTDRKSKGSITLRLRMEVDDERRLLTSCLEPPRTQYVNVKKRKLFKVIQYTCTGKYDMEKYSWNVIMAYHDELMTYKNLSLDLKDAIISLLFWRGQFDFVYKDKTYKLPIHSFTAFLIFVLLVERPGYIPSFFFASISWMMLAIMLQRRHNPNPWRQCKSFVELFMALATGSSGTGPHEIKVNQNLKEAVAFEARLRKRIEDAEAADLKAAKDAEAAQAAAEQEEKEIGETNVDISKKKGGISIDPFRKIMEPIQVNLQLVCKIIRYIRNILIWEECYLAFWITTGCFVLSIACMFVPWAFLILWTSRIVVWTIFGPWMKLVDVYYYRGIEKMSEEEIEKQKEKFKMDRKVLTMAKALEARIERENAQKLKDMKQLMFGKFIMKVPVLKEDRWRDIPLPRSKAEPYKPKSLAFAELAMQEAGYHRVRVPGQHLEGDMIPTIQTKAFTEAPVGQATKLHAANESDSVAYATIGSLVVGAAAITWFGIPLMSSMAYSVLGG